LTFFSINFINILNILDGIGGVYCTGMYSPFILFSNFFHMFSFAVGIKMNIFLFAPGLFIILLRRFGIFSTCTKIGICALVQFVLAVPFAIVNLSAYLSRAFNLGRIFIYYWSVNWKFIPENIFLSSEWGLFLLALTLGTWFFFFSLTNGVPED